VAETIIIRRAVPKLIGEYIGFLYSATIEKRGFRG